MTADEALEMIRAAVRAVQPDLAERVAPDVDLTGEGMLDSLDVMAFLFELEQLHGRRIEAIDENFSDFRVEHLIAELVSADT